MLELYDIVLWIDADAINPDGLEEPADLLFSAPAGQQLAPGTGVRMKNAIFSGG